MRQNERIPRSWSKMKRLEAFYEAIRAQIKAAKSRSRTQPIRLEKLTPEQQAVVRDTYAVIGKYAVPTYKQWERGFREDICRESELAIWQVMGETLLAWCKSHPDASEEAKKETVGDLCVVSANYMLPELELDKKKRQKYRVLKTLYLRACKRTNTLPFYPWIPRDFICELEMTAWTETLLLAQ